MGRGCAFSWVAPHSGGRLADAPNARHWCRVFRCRVPKPRILREFPDLTALYNKQRFTMASRDGARIHMSTNAERQAKWINKRNKLARVAEQLQQHDGKLFARLQRKAEQCAMQNRTRLKKSSRGISKRASAASQ
jgi:hypothetical protein